MEAFGSLRFERSDALEDADMHLLNEIFGIYDTRKTRRDFPRKVELELSPTLGKQRPQGDFVASDCPKKLIVPEIAHSAWPQPDYSSYRPAGVVDHHSNRLTAEIQSQGRHRKAEGAQISFDT